MRPGMLDPARDLAGATPRTLARALLRNRLLPRSTRKPIVGDQVAVEKVSANQSGDSISHLDEGS